MTDDDILAIVRRKSGVAGIAQKEISLERLSSLKYYRQDPFGNEIDGRSQVITSDVRDTVEWILPQLVEMFIGDENPVTFRPYNPQDIESAKDETKYVRSVYNNQNEGFLNTYLWFKDALIQKNGYLKIWWDENVQEEKENYENLTYPEVFALEMDKDLDVKKVEAFKDGEKVKDPTKFPMETLTYNVMAKRIRDESQICISVVAPENLIIDPTHDSLNLQTCHFMREDAWLTESDLLAEGFSQAVIDTLPSFSSFSLNTTEKQVRFNKQGGILPFTQISEDKATRKIKISDIYMRLDADGDGSSELIFIKTAGANDAVLLEREEVDTVPYFPITPVIMPHVHYGMSVADLVADLQLIKSTLWRQSLDSLYLSNNPRYAVVRGGVELDDLLTSRPGGIVRMDAIGNVQQLNTEFVGANALPMMDSIDKMREERTGVSSVTQGLDPNALADSTNLVGSMIMSAAMGRIKMIARIFAETGFKNAMLHIHELTMKYVKDETIASIGGDQFMKVNPANWKDRKHMDVRVGVGYADKQARITGLQNVMNMQKDIFAAQQGEGPLLNAQNTYNAVNDLLELAGLDARDRYFSNPEKYKAPPPKPDPAAQAQAQTLDIAKHEVILKAQQAAADHTLNVKKQQDDTRLKITQMMQDTILKREQMALDAGLSREDVAHQIIQTNMQHQSQLQQNMQQHLLEQQNVVQSQGQENPGDGGQEAS